MPWPDTEVKIVDAETGQRLQPVSQPGEICIRGPQVMKGYWPEPGSGLVDGWLPTGDVAKMVGYPAGWVWRLRHRDVIPAPPREGAA